jgi:aspartate-semialdehyde dehydrogenase
VKERANNGKQIMKKMEVGVLGATGLVGQYFVALLENHPWFDLKWLGASDRSAHRTYRQAAMWRLSEPMPESTAEMMVEECEPGMAPKLIFSALDSKVAGEIEGKFASQGHIVVSNASNYRMEPDVPLLVPEVNPEHLALVKQQGSKRGWKGMIVTNPNCSTVVLTMALAPLERQFGLQRVLVTTMQAISGAGYPGVPALDIVGNVIPFIHNEESKIETETRKILGRLKKKVVEDAPFPVSAQTNRVPVIDGHTESISVELKHPAKIEDLVDSWMRFQGIPQERQLPSAPPRPVIFLPGVDRPQPRLDVLKEGGMVAFVGHVRACPVLHFRFVAMGHNTIRGAAGAALLNAELMDSEKMLS